MVQLLALPTKRYNFDSAIMCCVLVMSNLFFTIAYASDSCNIQCVHVLRYLPEDFIYFSFIYLIAFNIYALNCV